MTAFVVLILIVSAAVLVGGPALGRFMFDHMDSYDRRDPTAPPDERDR